MSDERILHIIKELEQVRGRRGMFIGSNSSSATSAFLSGFDSACFALGLPLLGEMRQQAKEERGWTRGAEVWAVSEMQERGLPDEAIADEMLTIDIAAWRRMAEAGSA